MQQHYIEAMSQEADAASEPRGILQLKSNLRLELDHIIIDMQLNPIYFQYCKQFSGRYKNEDEIQYVTSTIPAQTFD